jgi:CDP-6-deoxy-D-xylo-4-hexulose-3-dehydrase
LAGSLSRQPYWLDSYGPVILPNCDTIHNNGMYLPNNAELTENDIIKICEIVNRFV